MDGFDAWLAYLFEDDSDDAWFSHYAATDTPVARAERIRHLFGNAGSLLSGYADDAVSDGVRTILDGDIGVFFDKKVPVVGRTRGMRSIVTLFAEVFAPRIQHEVDQRTPKIQHTCFMFFDIGPIDLGDDTMLDVLEEIAALPSIPCQRAALHGLGHAHFHVPGDVEPIVDRWLRRHRDAPLELREYAQAARAGQVM